MPAENGSVSPSAAAVATAASTALPPCLRTFSPILVASGSTLLTAPPYPSLVAFFGAFAWADCWSGRFVPVRRGVGRDGAGWGQQGGEDAPVA